MLMRKVVRFINSSDMFCVNKGAQNTEANLLLLCKRNVIVVNLFTPEIIQRAIVKT